MWFIILFECTRADNQDQVRNSVMVVERERQTDTKKEREQDNLICLSVRWIAVIGAGLRSEEERMRAWGIDYRIKSHRRYTPIGISRLERFVFDSVKR